MKIRFVIADAYVGGGTARTILSTAGALAQRGHDVEVASIIRSEVEPRFPVPEGVRLRPLTGLGSSLRSGTPHPVRMARWIARAGLARGRSRLIHRKDDRYAGFSLETDIALWRYLRALEGGVVIGTRPGLNLAVARLVSPSVVRVAQDHMNIGQYGDELRAAFQDSYPRLDALVTLTESDARIYRDLLGDSTRVLAVPNAVPHADDRRAALDPEGTVAVAAGRLSRQKGFDLLIRAWNGVAQAHPDWTLNIFGSGPGRKSLQRQIDDAGLGRQVRLRGFTTSLPAELEAASLYVLSSRFEGFPMVLLEAMGCGLPVVAFDCPTGPSELIEHGTNGILAKPRSVKALTEAINHAIEDVDLRRSMAKAAYETSLSYTPTSIAERWEQLFEQLAVDRGVRLDPATGTPQPEHSAQAPLT